MDSIANHPWKIPGQTHLNCIDSKHFHEVKIIPSCLQAFDIYTLFHTVFLLQQVCGNVAYHCKVFSCITDSLSTLILPEISSKSSNSGIAVISFDFSSVFNCPSSIFVSDVQALTIWIADLPFVLSCERLTAQIRSVKGCKHMNMEQPLGL